MSIRGAIRDVLTLPWTREKTELPCALPTHEQIEAATTEFPSTYSADLRRTVLVGGHYVVKYGPLVSENEGHALLLVESDPAILAPRLYAMYRENESLYIVMEYIAGQQLSDAWSSLTKDDKVSVVDQLRLVCNALQSIPPSGFYGGVLGGPIPHRFFFSLEKEPQVTGPFSKEEDLGHALALRSAKNWTDCGRHGWMSEFFARHIPAVLQGHDIVFTHADFQRKNILVEQKECLDTDGFAYKGSLKVKAVLDWESAGWYPSYWGYASCFIYFTWTDDWPEMVEKFLVPHVNEAAILKLVAQDLDA